MTATVAAGSDNDDKGTNDGVLTARREEAKMKKECTNSGVGWGRGEYGAFKFLSEGYFCHLT